MFKPDFSLTRLKKSVLQDAAHNQAKGKYFRLTSNILCFPCNVMFTVSSEVMARRRSEEVKEE